MTDDEVEQIIERVKNASTGPWTAEDDENSWDLYAAAPDFGTIGNTGIPMRGHPLKILKAPKHGTPYAEYWPNNADAELIVHASEDIHRLLIENARLKRLIQSLQSLIGSA